MTPRELSAIARLSSTQRAELADVIRHRIASRLEPSTDPDSTLDVAVLGGGVAGLTLALQLRSQRPAARILVIERDEHPVAETAHKVGESTVEIAAHYLKDVLGLGEHLENAHLRKFGLRMFFSNGTNDEISSRLEVGSSVFVPHPTYQLDRGRLENHLVERCRAAGVEVLTGSVVRSVTLRSGAQRHDVALDTPHGPAERSATWVVDATGRHRLLQRQLDLQLEVGHEANAAWFRVGHPIDVGSWSTDPVWLTALEEGRRELSTNHLMGEGYWVWLIRLGESAISVGIVADPAVHPFNEFNTLDRALDWLDVHEPQCARVMREHRDDVLDFRVMKDYSYSCRQVFDGGKRWALTGESGIFLDPLYSPGLDLIAIGNSLVGDLVTRSLDGADVTALAGVHDTLFRRLTDMWLGIYERQYGLMGHPTVMTTKVIWDTAFYWGVFALLFFSDKFRRISERPSVATDLAALTDISNRVQAFFREWAALDDNDPDRHFVDLYKPLDFMVALHAGMADELTDAEFATRFSANRALFCQLAGQLVSTVIETYGDRYADDEVMAQLQAWQRDPLIADFVTEHRRCRDTSPTSSGWIVLRPATGRVQPPTDAVVPAGTPNALAGTISLREELHHA
ncbi:MAG: NAD(P)/FAD-dependent oxidoreductase [Pseudonocardia sp.]